MICVTESPVTSEILQVSYACRFVYQYIYIYVHTISSDEGFASVLWAHTGSGELQGRVVDLYIPSILARDRVT